MVVTTTNQHSIESHFSHAMMIAGPVTISFTGRVHRNLEVADDWHTTYYPSLGMLITMTLIIANRHHNRVFHAITGVSPIGLLGGMLLSLALAPRTTLNWL